MPEQIVIRSSDGSTREVPLDGLQQPVVLGRDGDLAVVAIADPQISRVHCRLALIDGAWVVEDLSSRNGTWVNGARITRTVLRPGDRLKLGDTQVRLEASGGGPDPLIGARISGFAFEDVLGRGRFGVVYRGVQEALHRPVAIKVLAPEFANDRERVTAFLTEARRAGGLNHPNLVQVHDVISANGIYFLVMELMAGSVGEQLAEDGRLEEPAVRRIMSDVCAALSFAEQNRLVHRDVKPDNILYTEDGAYKLADLGIAAPIADDGLARQERIFGSPHYVAPEQARGGTIDGRADLYALGATVYHLLAGKPVFSGPTRDIIQGHLSRPAPDVREAAPEVSQGLAKLVAKLLGKRPTDRPASAAEVAAMVERLAEGKAAVRRPIRRRRYRRR
jgi:serine/threonine protein kinase